MAKYVSKISARIIREGARRYRPALRRLASSTRSFEVPEYWSEDDVGLAGQTVIEEEDDGWTGLLDAEGRDLYRVKPPMGFHRG